MTDSFGAAWLGKRPTFDIDHQGRLSRNGECIFAFSANVVDGGAWERLLAEVSERYGVTPDEHLEKLGEWYDWVHHQQMAESAAEVWEPLPAAPVEIVLVEDWIESDFDHYSEQRQPVAYDKGTRLPVELELVGAHAQLTSASFESFEEFEVPASSEIYYPTAWEEAAP